MSPRRLALLPLLAVLALALSALAAGAAPARHAAAAGSGPVYALDPLSHTLKVKPHKLEFRDVAMTELRWKRWGRRVARARGISRILTCSPSCGSGGAQTTATTVKLSRIREKGGKRRYTCMSWRDDQKVSDLPDHGSLNPFNFRPCKPPGAPASAAAARCRGIDLGFTTATVLARRMACRKARLVILEWKRKSAEGAGPEHVRALGFDCHFSGAEVLRLRCTKGEKLAKATWGD